VEDFRAEDRGESCPATVKATPVVSFVRTCLRLIIKSREGREKGIGRKG